MLERDLVSWDRRDVYGSGELGEPQHDSVDDFPLDVRGDWQEQGEDDAKPSGLGEKVAVKFYSEYQDGKVGDQVTKDDVVYIVKYRTRNAKLFESTIDHVEYGLAYGGPVASYRQ